MYPILNDHLKLLYQEYHRCSEAHQRENKVCSRIQIILNVDPFILILADEKLNTLVLNSVLAGKNKSQELFNVCLSNSLKQFQKKQGNKMKGIDGECDVQIPEVKQNR